MMDALSSSSSKAKRTIIISPRAQEIIHEIPWSEDLSVNARIKKHEILSKDLIECGKFIHEFKFTANGPDPDCVKGLCYLPHVVRIGIRKTEEKSWAERVDRAECCTTRPQPCDMDTDITMERKNVTTTGGKRTRIDDEGFVTPVKVSRQPENVTSLPAETENRYQVLDDSTQYVAIASTPPILIGLPPNYHDFVFIMVEDLGFDVDVKLQGDLVKIMPKDQEQRMLICNYLKNKNVNFIMTMKSSEKPIKCVLKGLPVDTSTDDILEALKEQSFHPFKITQLKSFRTKLSLPIFQLQLNNTPYNQNIYKITKLMHTIISIVKYRSPHNTQCYNCQRFGHTAATCITGPRCRKCAGNHKSTECNTTTPEVKTCSNCNGPHPSTFKGCPKNPRSRFIPLKTNTATKTYAEATKHSQKEHEQNNNYNLESLIDILNYLKNIDLNQIFNLIKQVCSFLQNSNVTQLISNLPCFNSSK